MPAKFHVDPVKERYWRAEIAKLEASGLSGGEFCRRHGHKYTLFADWRARLRRLDARGGIPEEVRQDLNSDWLSIIEEARAFPAGVNAFCLEQGIDKKLYYRRFRKLRKEHPEWKALRRGRALRGGATTPKAAITNSLSGRTSHSRGKLDFAAVKLVDRTTDSGHREEATVEIVLPNSVVLRVGTTCSPEFLGTLVSELRNR